MNQPDPVVYSAKQLHILEAAERLFADRGFVGASIRDIAAEAGVNVAMISYYFGSKEKLLEAIFHHRVQTGRMLMNELMHDKEHSALEKMDLLIDNYAERLLNNPGFHRIMMREQQNPDMAWFAAMVSDMKNANRDLITKLIQMGQRRGEFRKGMEVPLVMATVMGTLQHILSAPVHMRAALKGEEMTDVQYQTFLLKKTKAHLRAVLRGMLQPDSK